MSWNGIRAIVYKLPDFIPYQQCPNTPIKNNLGLTMQSKFWSTFQEFTNAQLAVVCLVVVLGLFLSFSLGAGWATGLL